MHPKFIEERDRVLSKNGWIYGRVFPSCEIAIFSPPYHTPEFAYTNMDQLRADYVTAVASHDAPENTEELGYRLETFRDGETIHLILDDELEAQGARVMLSLDFMKAGIITEAPRTPRCKALISCAVGSPSLMSSVDQATLLDSLRKMKLKVGGLESDPRIQKLFEEANTRVARWQQRTGIILNRHNHDLSDMHKKPMWSYFGDVNPTNI